MKKLALFAFIAIGLMNCSSDDSDTVTLTENEKNDLKILREEEKLARDVYAYTYNKYGLEISNNISKSEQKHMDKIVSLLNEYNIEDPALPNAGEFVNQTLQTLYDDLIAQVDISVLEALKVGAIIEDLDIKDIEEFEARTSNNEILNVYEKLKCGSRNHMRSYYSELTQNGFIYIAQFIPETQLASIVTSSNEQCGR